MTEIQKDFVRSLSEMFQQTIELISTQLNLNEDYSHREAITFAIDESKMLFENNETQIGLELLFSCLNEFKFPLTFEIYQKLESLSEMSRIESKLYESLERLIVKR